MAQGSLDYIGTLLSSLQPRELVVQRELLRAVKERYGDFYATGLDEWAFVQDAAVERLCAFIQRELGLRSSWWSGRDELPEGIDLAHFDYIKTGPYIAELGGLKSRRTNQRLYRVDHPSGGSGPVLQDITNRFWR